MEVEWNFDDSEVIASGYDYIKFKEVLKQSEEYLLQLNPEKRLEIIKELLKNPNFDDTDVCYLAMIDIQDPSYKPPSIVHKKPPLKIRFVMSGSQPTKTIRMEEKAAKKDKRRGPKRPRGNSDCDFDEEEEKDMAIKKRANMKKVNNLVQEKKKVNDLVQKRKVDVSEIIRDLPDEFKERIQILGGTSATLVIQKALTATDVSTSHGRLSLPRGVLIDKEFLSGEKKHFLERKNGNTVSVTKAQLIAENGKKHEIDIRQWNMSKRICVLVKGWNNVVSEHGLSEDRLVQLWSFRVKGSLWFALVKL